MANDQVSGAHQQADPHDEFTPDPRNVKLLKWAIYIMSALLVIGVIVVAVTIATRTSKLAGPGASGFAALDVAIAAGAMVSDIKVDGDRMVVHVTKPGAPGEILIFNLRHGRLDGRVRLQPSN